MTTAINIGSSCRLLSSHMDLIILDKEQDGDEREPVLKRLEKEHETITNYFPQSGDSGVTDKVDI